MFELIHKVLCCFNKHEFVQQHEVEIIGDGYMPGIAEYITGFKCCWCGKTKELKDG